MGKVIEHIFISEEDYLAAEDKAAGKSEYLAGAVYAMAGAGERHSLRYYLMADSDRVAARLLLRDAGAWREQTLGAEDRVAIDCNGAALTLSLADIYEDTGLPI